jgi:hypothetical protein
MTDLTKRLLALAENAIEEALQYSGGYRDPDHCNLYRELQELRQLVQQGQQGPTDEELLRCYGLAKRNHCYEGPMDDWPKRAERAATVCGLRAVIAADRARWGRPVIAPVPTDEELYDTAEVFNGDPVPAMRRALELWGRPVIEPIPYSVRLPGLEDCDSDGKCWSHDPWLVKCWWYQEPCDRDPRETHWLPYYALPIPNNATR